MRRAPALRSGYREHQIVEPLGTTVLPATLPFVFAILWASSYAAAKIGLVDITPYAFVAIRLAIAAAAAVVTVLALKRPWKAIKQRWPHLLVGGALAHGLALATAHKALVSVAATPTALVHAFHPILTAALGVIVVGERFPGGNKSASGSACRTMPIRASSRCWP
jgi:drug/metabolite transporter (DMT)-like permease